MDPRLLLLGAALLQPPAPAVDAQGDPLPKGALLRIGTVRPRALACRPFSICQNFPAFGETL